MPRRKKGSLPPYCLHKQSGQAYVRLNGQQFLLGRHGTPESWEDYRRTLAEWQANGCRLPEETEASAYTIRQLTDDYLAHCRVYYRRLDGSQTPETDTVKLSFRELLELYASIPAADFGLVELKAVRHKMIEVDLARSNINDRIGRIVRAFGWAAEELKVPTETWGALRALRRLKRGRSPARETEPVKPVLWEDVQPVLAHVCRQVAAMIMLQWHTAMRPGEVVQLRPADLDRTGAVWIYRPRRHKIEHHGKERVIGIGPRGQEVLLPFLNRVPLPDPDKPLFSPLDAMAENRTERRRRRQTPLWNSHLKRNAKKRKKQPKRTPGESYDVHAYRRAIARGCRLAGVPTWSPNRLRHAAATRLRAELGIEAARVVLGHSSAATSEIYAEIDRIKALDVMGQLG